MNRDTLKASREYLEAKKLVEFVNQVDLDEAVALTKAVIDDLDVIDALEGQEALEEDSTNPDYKGKTVKGNRVLTHINMKGGKYASAGDAGLHAVAKSLFKTRTIYRGPRAHRGNVTNAAKKDATGAAVYTV
jgi:hypothetical protein